MSRIHSDHIINDYFKVTRNIYNMANVHAS